MHPRDHAARRPDHPACIIAESGECLTYAELDARSNRAAQYFRSIGINQGDSIAILLENQATYFEICWAAQRSGLYFICISSKLKSDEAAYIVEDCGAKLLVAAASLRPLAKEISARFPGIPIMYVDDPDTTGQRTYPAACADMPSTPIADETAGYDMLYSSGTTGRPKGIAPAPVGGPIDHANPMTELAANHYGIGADTVFLSPAPLYHAAPLRWCMAVHRLGGTVVVMQRFDAECALQLIERYHVTHSQWVPTHFVRMLKLPSATRTHYDLSSHRMAVHAAAPCPIDVKRAMLDWWGPIIHEYYSGTEANGFTAVSPAEWLERPGTVGKALSATLRICDEDGEPLPPRAEGLIYFENGPKFSYHNDPQKLADCTNRYGWTTLGDVGWVDEDGYLFLTDRKSFMIISGGVNIYPQEIEDILLLHPQVEDAAVVSAPDEDMGEKVVAVVQPADMSLAGEALAAELIQYTRERLSHVKVPRLVVFEKELPRQATGKLYKRLLRERFWQKPSPSAG